MELAQLLKALADETRIRILNLLREEKLCVCEMEVILGISQSNASRHLNKLKMAKIIVCEKKGQWVYYSLNNRLLKDHPFLTELVHYELPKIEEYREDLESLRKYKKSRITCGQLKEKWNLVISGAEAF